MRFDLGSEQTLGFMSRAPLHSRDFVDFAHRGDAEQRLARRRLVKSMVGLLAGVHPGDVIIGRTALGAPLVSVPTGWHVSVSGHGSSCLIGAARQPIGVDAERPDEPPPADDHFTLRELATLRSVPTGAISETRLHLWIAKEAHAKRTRRARLIEASDIEVARRSEGLFARSAGAASRIWIHRTSGMLCAVALGTRN